MKFLSTSLALSLAFTTITDAFVQQEIRKNAGWTTDITSTAILMSNGANSNDEEIVGGTKSRRQSLMTIASSASAAFLFSIDPFHTNVATAADDTSATEAATFAVRRVGALPPSLTNLPPTPSSGVRVRFGETILANKDATRSPGKDAFVQFDFPADWLQLDRLYNGITYVDQRNGDKLYLLRIDSPEDGDGAMSLEKIPKAFFGEAIFNPKGDIVKTGNPVEEYKVLSSTTLCSPSDETAAASCTIPRRRLKVRYTTVTGNNFTVERKGLVDIYQIKGVCYMLMTGSNAVLFDKKGRERENAESIVDSFRVIVAPSV